MKKIKKLRLKFFAGFLVVGIIGFLLISTLGSDAVLKVIENTRAQDMYSEAVSVSREFADSYSGRSSSIGRLSGQFSDRLSGIADGLGSVIWIISDDGTICYDSEGTRTDSTISGFDAASFGKGSRRSYMETGNFYGMFSEDQISVMASIHVGYETKGYVLIHCPVSSLAQNQYDILNLVYVTGLAVYLLSFIILLVYRYAVSKPLNEITKAADAFAKGDLTYECPVNTADEMGYLSATLNYMASELNHSEQYQKKFISNVSHDFRSPLTSIRGYLAAMQDGTIPPDFYDHYFGILIKETERLTKLTEGLLALNRMSGPAALNYTNFDINQTIRETCASFEGKCAAKNLEFNLTFAEKKLTVSADYDRIQQVLYNLIDNAIKFSHSNSSIDIETRESNNKIFVSVKDHGIGISRENQKKVFERFYKVDNSRGKDKQGTGLGLSIVKEIINAHGQSIDVISTEGVGTEFVFSLAKNNGR